MEIKMKNDEIRRLLNIESPKFPKYATQIINLANQNAKATRPKVVGKMSELVKEFTGRTKDMVRRWVRDLVIVKTFIGLRFQEAILKRIANEFKTHYRLSTPEEEGRGIDGYIGDVPVSLKPTTYRSKGMLPEKIEADIIFYEKTKDGLRILIPEELKSKLEKR
jgi:hypothetical protein